MNQNDLFRIAANLPPCCAPTKLRAAVLLTSRVASAERWRATSGSTEGMTKLDGGQFLMGSEDADSIAADGEGPIRPVRVDPFYLDTFPVTNRQFAEFVQATGYVTEAERFHWSFVFEGHLRHRPAVAESAIHPPKLHWWLKIDGADWRHPEGPESNLDARPNHPVVQVSWNDAEAYAKWANKRLPTEAEWEFAARGALEQKRFPWGDDLTPEGRHLCNIWQGDFPTLDLAEDGYDAPAPVDAFPPNGYGLYSITGNTWEWCSDWFSPDFHLMATRENPVGPNAGAGKSMRGGSYLCHASYCNRYRVAARTQNTPDSATTNIGFRCAMDLR
jgi:formylglycine-generating enzyme required for sulfatase activity